LFSGGHHKKQDQRGSKMTGSDDRRFTRVDFNQTVRLKFGEKNYDQQIVSNISLGGIYIKGRFEQQPKDICTIEAEHRWSNGETVKFLAKGAAVRLTDEGMAVEFLSMPHDSLQFLQTALLYQAEDPLAIGVELGKHDVSFAFDDTAQTELSDNFLQEG
jgi:hypothetical protein